MSGREPPELGSDVGLRKVIQGAHAFRRARSARRELDLAETSFIVQLTAFALLGDAVFGERMRRIEGISEGPTASRAFRVRLGKLLEAQLNVIGPTKGAPPAVKRAKRKTPAR